MSRAECTKPSFLMKSDVRSSVQVDSGRGISACGIAHAAPQLSHAAPCSHASCIIVAREGLSVMCLAASTDATMIIILAFLSKMRAGILPWSQTPWSARSASLGWSHPPPPLPSHPASRGRCDHQTSLVCVNRQVLLVQYAFDTAADRRAREFLA